MNVTAPKTRNKNTQPSCQHVSTAGRHCRMPVADAASSRCYHHALQSKRETDNADLFTILTNQCEEFQTSAGINHSLGELYALLSQNRISPRRASVLAYVCSLLLRTLPGLQKEESAEHDSPQFIFDLPRPIRPPLDEPVSEVISKIQRT